MFFRQFQVRLLNTKCQYLTISAGEMSKSKGGTSQNWVNRFFGSFFFIFQLNQLFGNLISSLVIQGGFPDSSSLPEATEDEINQVRQRCGLSFKRGWHKKLLYCSKVDSNNENLKPCFKSFWLKLDLIFFGIIHDQASDDGGCDSIEPIDDTTVYTLMGIYTGCGVVAISMVALLVDPLEVPEMNEKESTWKLAQTTLRKWYLLSRSTEYLSLQIHGTGSFSGLVNLALRNTWRKSLFIL